MVLIVDDDPDIRETLVELLSSEGYEVATASDGAEGLQSLEEVRPDLVLLDLNMPRVSGWEFRSRQAEDPRLAAIPVVVMSAWRMVDVDAHAYLAKPFDADTLLGLVSRYARPGRPAGARSRSGGPPAGSSG